jgi:outer membrane protein assembly factor BamB
MHLKQLGNTGSPEVAGWRPRESVAVIRSPRADTIPCLSYIMKQRKIFLLVLIALLSLLLVSCISGSAAVTTGWAGATIQNGIIYAGTRAGIVVAINSSTESQQWEYTVNSPIYTTPIADGDVVYVGTYSGQVLALSTLARSQNLTFPQQRYGEWEWDCPAEGGRSNAIVADLVMSDGALYVASSNGRVYSLDKETGDENWNRRDISVLAEKLWTSLAIQGDTLYVSTFDDHVYALSVATGESLNWSFKSDAGFASSPVIDGGTIYVGSFDRHLYAIGIGGNVSMWKFPQEKPAGNWFWASPIVDKGIVYAGCLDGKIYAIEAQKGEELWEFDTGSPIVASPVLMDNSLIVANEAGDVYVFDLSAQVGEQGVPSESVSIGAAVDSSFCAQDGLAYIRGEDNQLYVVDVDKAKVREISLVAQK